ncbi:alpha/beta fold hydrolase [Tepidibacillus infernus]|uniref:Serine aminopeptidase S33 domain-containing protein n=1 Tax=Tepidibacillus decaturensis TaxID=1413211 RepID=A0A135L5R6_9BACI|nr:alpha/beta fold hydrolase [Tepidibacillus decaturensis]KXG44355.1 hypothetical protein U473_10310 [Tepidibacillus decaturensis]
MKITKKSPEPFYYQGDKRIGLLLIHGFTGSPAEIRLLGDFLQQKGYAVYAPLLAGHGTSPEEMAKTNQEDWWNSVLEAYEFMKSEGYDQIISIGLSMGGILSLKLAMEKPLLAVIPMAAPIFVHDKRMAFARWIKYIKAYQVKGKKVDQIEENLASYDRTPIKCVESLHRLIKEVKHDLPRVHCPVFIMQGKRDETVIPESANYIYRHISSSTKEIKWYEQSTHILTIDQEREKVFEDLYLFISQISQ